MDDQYSSAAALVQNFHLEVQAGLRREEKAQLEAAVSALAATNMNSLTITGSSTSLVDHISPFEISTNRAHSSMNFIVPQFGEEALDLEIEDTPLLETYTIEDQEKTLMQDLLYVLSGKETPLISTYSIGHNKIGFTVDQRIEPSLRDLTLQIAQVGCYYFTVTRFVENRCKFEHGQVNQALCAAIRSILKEYQLFLAQIESQNAKGDMTLQRFWYHVNPMLQQMSCISSIVCAIEESDCIGGQVLTVLHEKVLSMVGNGAAFDLCMSLTQQSSLPYFRILENWIYKGIIKDPFGDFFISQSLNGLSDEDLANDPSAIDIYWDKKYLKDLKKCPSFIRRYSEEILKAGKYLNVIRQCGKDVSFHKGCSITYSVHDRMYGNPIEQAYNFASKTLLNVLLKEYDLMKRIESVKHYLLMSQGDFIMQFLDLTEDELRKPVEDLIETKLSSLLELALRTSSLTDPYKDSIKVQLIPFAIREQMSKIITITAGQSELFFPSEDTFVENGIGVNYALPGFEAFAFSYEVEWPISIVLNCRALFCYQIIFRHLFFCKHVERQLCRTWSEGGNNGGTNSHTRSPHFENATVINVYTLRHKMLTFIQNLLYYMAFEVIEPAWHNFTATMTKVQNVDDVISLHFHFVNTVLAECMLTNQAILDKMTELFRVCLRFCDKCLGTISVQISALSHPKSKSVNTLQRLDDKFSKALVAFLRLVSQIVQNPDQSTKVVNIIHRMNFNSYYTEALEAEK